jgi:prepilin-type N-terminal cleavage/methylation domain-containing protein/prepilin-type processing-associated H-X9-DG protein
MTRRFTSAFTIVELLVVIAIIGVLMALLLPAVQAARESGRRTACMNNLYQLGMAVNRYDQDAGKIPSWSNSVGGRTVSWPVVLLPYIERNDLYETWTAGGVALTNINTFTCPSSPPAKDAASPPTWVGLGYAGNCGDGTTNVYNGVMPSPAASVKYSLSDVSDGDGLGTTLLFAEKCANEYQSNWGINGFLAFSFQENGLDGNNSLLQLPAFGVWFISGNLGASIPKSQHPTGFNVAFCDGHTKFVRNDIAATTLIQLITSRNSKATACFQSGALDESSY